MLRCMRALLPIAILSVLGVAAASAVGCSASVTLTPGTPPGKTFVGPGGVAVDFGSACTGSYEFVDGSGWAYCTGSVWDYSTTDPGYGSCSSDSECGISGGGDGGGTTGEGGGSTGEGGGSTGGEGGGSTGGEAGGG